MTPRFDLAQHDDVGFEPLEPLNPLPRPNTLLIDSEELESGEALDDRFRAMAADEIERFRREIVERSGDARAAEIVGERIEDDAVAIFHVMPTQYRER